MDYNISTNTAFQSNIMLIRGAVNVDTFDEKYCLSKQMNNKIALNTCQFAIYCNFSDTQTISLSTKYI